MDDILDLITKLGEEKALSILNQHVELESAESEDVLTIVVNRGVHHLPENSLRGVVFYASEGNLDFSSAESVQWEFEKILKNLTHVLQSRNWRKVYVLPFGPCALSMQIKLLIYRITRIESVDIFYLGEGEYMDLKIRQRCLIVNADG